MKRTTTTFAALVLAQAAHSIEETAGRLWESFPPARFLTGLLSTDREMAFIAVNVAIVAFGVWCLFWPVRREWRSAVAVMWGWVAVEAINGFGHSAWSLLRGGYTPGVLTAPVLLVVAIYLGGQLSRSGRSSIKNPGVHHE